MSLFTVADFEKLNIGYVPPTEDLSKKVHEIVAHNTIGVQDAEKANKLQKILLDEKHELVRLFSSGLFKDDTHDVDLDRRRSIVFKIKKDSTKYIFWVKHEKKVCNTNVTLWIDEKELPYDQIANYLTEHTPLKKTIDQIALNICRTGQKLYNIMNAILSTLKTDTKAPIGDSYYLGPMSILICKKDPKTEGPSCKEQAPHWDFDIDKLKNMDDGVKPLSVILNPMSTPAKLITVGPDKKRTEHTFKQNEYIAFRGDLGHAGAAYDVDHVRFHAYILHPQSIQAYSENKVEFLSDHVGQKRRHENDGSEDEGSENEGSENEGSQNSENEGSENESGSEYNPDSDEE